jgi:hypothetical protein
MYQQSDPPEQNTVLGRDPINIQTSSVSSPLLAGEKSFRDI